MLGGHSQAKADVNGSVLAKLQHLKADLEVKHGSSINTMEVVSYTSQVVNGTNYTAKVRVNGNTDTEVMFYESLQSNNGNGLQLNNYTNLSVNVQAKVGLGLGLGL